jgi:hypothetical protein
LRAEAAGRAKDRDRDGKNGPFRAANARARAAERFFLPFPELKAGNEIHADIVVKTVSRGNWRVPEWQVPFGDYRRT